MPGCTSVVPRSIVPAAKLTPVPMQARWVCVAVADSEIETVEVGVVDREILTVPVGDADAVLDGELDEVVVLDCEMLVVAVELAVAVAEADDEAEALGLGLALAAMRGKTNVAP